MQDSHIRTIKGVGDHLVGLFGKLGITTIQELLEYVPFRFDDYSHIVQIANIAPGPVTLKAQFTHVRTRYSKKGLHVTEARATDATGTVSVVWFNQPYRAKSIKLDEDYYISGEFAQNYKYFAITNPASELATNFPINTARMVPIYRVTKGLTTHQLRRIIRTVVQHYVPTETLPEWLCEQERLISRSDALLQMHFPDSAESLALARNRLGFEEVFELSLAAELNRQEFAKLHSMVIPFDAAMVRTFVAALPFALTDDQRRVAWTIFNDMQQGMPMNRLVEGDVGSGKTVVAALAMLGAVHAGYQAAFMAPTELLAQQHYESLRKIFSTTPYADAIVLLTGALTNPQKIQLKDAIAAGSAQIVVGTHALVQDSVSFHSLGLVVVDEQHRFGVAQRKKLQSKAAEMPHVLHMTATPIPRSLALTLYGEMDVARITQLPKGRIPITTQVYIPEQREKVYEDVIAHITEGRQAFVVCPQIEEDEAGRLSVIALHVQLTKKWLRGYRVGLLHGKMKSVEKESVMKQFVDGSLDVLVATTVIEVGVDVPNASYMVIEGADRFGLAQLHQLRGRIGRGAHASFCALVLESNDSGTKRVAYMEQETSGFKLAEYDLQMRGPGAIYGAAQHGALDLRVARLDDTELISRARAAAKQFVAQGEQLIHYTELHNRVQRLRSVTNLN